MIKNVSGKISSAMDEWREWMVDVPTTQPVREPGAVPPQGPVQRWPDIIEAPQLSESANRAWLARVDAMRPPRTEVEYIYRDLVHALNANCEYTQEAHHRGLPPVYTLRRNAYGRGYSDTELALGLCNAIRDGLVTVVKKQLDQHQVPSDLGRHPRYMQLAALIRDPATREKMQALLRPVAPPPAVHAQGFRFAPPPPMPATPRW